MARLNRYAGHRITGAVFSMFMLCAGGSMVAASAVSASTDFPLQPQCGPDPLTLIDPCAVLPPGVTDADSAPEVPWDQIDSALFA